MPVRQPLRLQQHQRQPQSPAKNQTIHPSSTARETARAAAQSSHHSRGPSHHPRRHEAPLSNSDADRCRQPRLGSYRSRRPRHPRSPLLGAVHARPDASTPPERSRAQSSDVGGGRGDVDMGGSERPRGRTCSDRLEAGDSVVEVGGQRRVEYQQTGIQPGGKDPGRGPAGPLPVLHSVSSADAVSSTHLAARRRGGASRSSPSASARSTVR